MKSTKPTRFIACFDTMFVREEQRHNFDRMRHVNQTTNELLSVKCFHFEDEYYDERSCAIFLHSHLIVANGEEHDGNMLLINKMVETIYNDGVEDNFVIFNRNRHINVYRMVSFFAWQSIFLI